MTETKTYQMRVQLEKLDGTYNTVTIDFAVQGKEVVGITGSDTRGDKYNIDLVFNRAGGGECYVCLEDPCPPNRYKEVNPCPFGILKKQHKES